MDEGEIHSMGFRERYQRVIQKTSLVQPKMKAHRNLGFISEVTPISLHEAQIKGERDPECAEDAGPFPSFEVGN